jgi:hypothetical protein
MVPCGYEYMPGSFSISYVSWRCVPRPSCYCVCACVRVVCVWAVCHMWRLRTFFAHAHEIWSQQNLFVLIRCATPLHTYVFSEFCICVYGMWGTRWRSWLRHSATSRKAAGFIPDGVFEILHWLDPSGRTMALWSTQPLTEMSAMNLSWRVKADNLASFMCRVFWKSWECQSPGSLGTDLDLYRDSFICATSSFAFSKYIYFLEPS